MNGNPLITVIIATYNRAHLIAETIQSVMDQSYGNWELLIIDDGSEDETRDVIDSFDDTRIIYLRVDHCGSLGELRNLGIRHAKGDYIAIQDSDDLWLQEKLSFQIDLLARYPEAYFVFGNGEFFGTKEYVEPECDELFVGDTFLPFLLHKRFVFLAPTLMFKKEVIAEIGFMDESFKCAAEIDFFLRMSRAKIGIFSNRKLVRIRKHDQNTSSDPTYGFLSFYDAIQIVEKLYQQQGLTSRQFKNVVKDYYYGLGLLGIRSNQNSIAFQSFCSYIKVNPLHWKGWIRVFQTLLVKMLFKKHSRQQTSVTN